MRIVALIFCCCLYMGCDQAENVEVIWQYIDVPTSEDLEQIKFDANGIGHFVGGDTWVLGITGISRDGGNSWTVDSVCNKRLFDLQFDDHGTGYASGIDGILMIFGADEKWKYNRIGTYEPSRGVFFGPKGEGITVTGSAFGNGEIQRFNQNLIREQVDTFDYQLEDVVYSDSTTIHIAGYGVIMRSIDAGRTWERNEPSQGDFFQEIQFLNETLGYTIGYGGSILKTTDAGVNWEFLRRGKNWLVTDAPFRALHFLDENEGYVVGEKGTLFYTDNGGTDWQSINNLPDENFLDITIYEGKGYLVGENGVLVCFSIL